MATKKTDSRKKILIVEDDVSMLNALHDKFEAEGLKVVLAGNGKEGLALALKTHPEIILLDILMPVMDGIKMLKKLRKDAWGKDAKVIVLSNVSDNDRVVAAVEQGTREYFVKTAWKLDSVVKIVKEHLKNSY
jgi:DNA-binding response OmpR family regulator